MLWRRFLNIFGVFLVIWKIAKLQIVPNLVICVVAGTKIAMPNNSLLGVMIIWGPAIDAIVDRQFTIMPVHISVITIPVGVGVIV